MDDDQIFHNVITELFVTAKRDGIITEQEAAIIETVKIDAAKFVEVHKRAIADGVITDDEAEELEKLKMDIYTHARSVALEDGTFNYNERDLIKKLVELCNRYYG